MIKQTTLQEAIDLQRSEEDRTISTLGKSNGAAKQVPQSTTDPANDLNKAIAETRTREDACTETLSKTNGKIE